MIAIQQVARVIGQRKGGARGGADAEEACGRNSTSDAAHSTSADGATETGSADEVGSPVSTEVRVDSAFGVVWRGGADSTQGQPSATMLQWAGVGVVICTLGDSHAHAATLAQQDFSLVVPISQAARAAP
jgi:hypothetical protein